MDAINIHNIVGALLYSGIGVLILLVTFCLADRFIPHYHIWKEIVEKQNVALAILLGAFAIGISSIIAAAVHG